MNENVKLLSRLLRVGPAFVLTLLLVNITDEFHVCSLQLLKRPVSGVRRMAAHPILPYCKQFCLSVLLQLILSLSLIVNLSNVHFLYLVVIIIFFVIFITSTKLQA